ncbi:aminoacyl-tRNA deacylase [Spartinivicinus ruber]|uniref:aminoacyl-tRNA deacylase n=1 Tax=Spartinivicinus ruber TaxID=2683272 RepID=UPI0013D24806|nr:YbaK/EbsC family protein [Spartinivicinus ruber]
MAIPQLTEYLQEKNIPFSIHEHSAGFTAQEVAQSAHIPGKDFAKTVMVKVDDVMSMVVMPSNYAIDLNTISEYLGAVDVELAHESEFSDLFPHCKTGAMPPFGNLFDIPVYVAEALVADHKVAFNAGNHNEIIRMEYRDFERLVKPKVVRGGFYTQSGHFEHDRPRMGVVKH